MNLGTIVFKVLFVCSLKKFQKVDISKNVEDWDYSPQYLGKYDVGLCINMIHISPIECTHGLFSNMSKVIRIFKALLQIF